jgi:heparosan-N-sulfate-glucuronate 5-epimerase
MKRRYTLTILVCFLGAFVIGNFTERRVRTWIEALYQVVMRKPMVYTTNQLDDKGIPYLIDNKVGKQRNPVIVCNQALAYYDRFKEGDSTQRILFLNCANWLIENSTTKNGFTVLPYNYNWSIYNMVSPWRSGLTNGVSLQVFIKAHSLTNDQKYLDIAKRVLNSFYVEVSEGGVTYKFENKGWWFEEFASETGYVSRVLNGHLFALLGIHDYFEYTQDPHAKYLFEQGMRALKNNLALYDSHVGPSYYDLRSRPTDRKYHAVHIDLLEKLFKITNDPLCRFYIDKWKTYQHPSLTSRLIKWPIKRIDLAIWLFNFVILSTACLLVQYIFIKKNSFQ